MPNRSCDFCSNRYAINPKAGYFKITPRMRKKLQIINENVDFICGIHFKDEDFLDNGKLKPSAIPEFFPSFSALQHDHDYCLKEGTDENYCFNDVGKNFIH